MKKVFLYILFLLLMANVGIYAVTKTLKSGGGSSIGWNNGGSWTPSGVPTASDTVLLTSSSNNLDIDVNAQ
jgi:hypothetical protein